MWFKENYLELNGESYKWIRVDGAVVKYDTDHYYSKPWLENHRGWIVFPPNSSTYLGYKRKNSKFNIPRKYKTEQSAMKIIDKLYPL